MSSAQKPEKETPRWVLWLLGIVGGFVVAVIAFMAGDDAESSREMASGIGAWSVRLLLLAVILGGGWGVLKRKKGQ